MPVQRLCRKPVNDVVLRLSSKQKTFSLGSAEEQDSKIRAKGVEMCSLTSHR